MSRDSSGNDELEELRRQTRWLRFIALQQLIPILPTLLRGDQEKRAYQLSDGSRTTREVAILVGTSQATISRWWSRWTAMGLATQDANGRVTHLVDPEELGMIG